VCRYLYVYTCICIYWNRARHFKDFFGKETFWKVSITHSNFSFTHPNSLSFTRISSHQFDSLLLKLTQINSHQLASTHINSHQFDVSWNTFCFDFKKKNLLQKSPTFVGLFCKNIQRISAIFTSISDFFCQGALQKHLDEWIDVEDLDAERQKSDDCTARNFNLKVLIKFFKVLINIMCGANIWCLRGRPFGPCWC